MRKRNRMSIPNLARLTRDTRAPSNAHALHSNTSLLSLPPELKKKIFDIINYEDDDDYFTDSCKRMGDVCRAHPELCDEDYCKELCAWYGYDTEAIRDAFLHTIRLEGSPFDAERAIRDHPWRVCFFQLCARRPVEQRNFKKAINRSEYRDWTHKLYGHISFWDVSHVTKMKEAFQFKYEFNEDLSLWDVSHVSNFDSMFYGAQSFNKAHLLNDWEVRFDANITDMFGSLNAPYTGTLPDWY